MSVYVFFIVLAVGFLGFCSTVMRRDHARDLQREQLAVEAEEFLGARGGGGPSSAPSGVERVDDKVREFYKRLRPVASGVHVSKRPRAGEAAEGMTGNPKEVSDEHRF